MPTCRQFKDKAREQMRTTQPHPCLVALVLVIISLVIDYLMQKIGAGTVAIDLDALRSGDFSKLLTLDLSNITAISGVLTLAFRILSVVLSYGFISYMLNVARRQPSGVGDLFDGFVVFLRSIWLNILMTIIIGLLTCLLIIPGLIAAYAYSMAPYLLFDHPEWGAWRCMKESKKMMRGHKWNLFILNLSFILWYILSVIPGVNIFVSPFTGLASANFYLYLCGEGDFCSKPSPEIEDRPPWEY